MRGGSNETTKMTRREAARTGVGNPTTEGEEGEPKCPKSEDDGPRTIFTVGLLCHFLANPAWL